MCDQKCLIWVFLGQNFQKAIVIFEISTLEFVEHESLTHTMNFGIRSAFCRGLGFAFSEGPGPLYKVCHNFKGYFITKCNLIEILQWVIRMLLLKSYCIYCVFTSFLFKRTRFLVHFFFKSLNKEPFSLYFHYHLINSRKIWILFCRCRKRKVKVKLWLSFE